MDGYEIHVCDVKNKEEYYSFILEDYSEHHIPTYEIFIVITNIYKYPSLIEKYPLIYDLYTQLNNLTFFNEKNIDLIYKLFNLFTCINNINNFFDISIKDDKLKKNIILNIKNLIKESYKNTRIFEIMILNLNNKNSDIFDDFDYLLTDEKYTEILVLIYNNFKHLCLKDKENLYWWKWYNKKEEKLYYYDNLNFFLRSNTQDYLIERFCYDKIIISEMTSLYNYCIEKCLEKNNTFLLNRINQGIDDYSFYKMMFKKGIDFKFVNIYYKIKNKKDKLKFLRHLYIEDVNIYIKEISKLNKENINLIIKKNLPLTSKIIKKYKLDYQNIIKDKKCILL